VLVSVFVLVLVSVFVLVFVSVLVLDTSSLMIFFGVSVGFCVRFKRRCQCRC